MTDLTTRIDFKQFIVDDLEHGRRVSLRALVEEGGLYTRFDVAKRAAEKSNLRFRRSAETPETGGPAREDLLFESLEDAQVFCVQTPTDVGRQLARLIVNQWGVLQDYMEGNEEAAALVHEQTRADLSPGMQALCAMIDRMVEQERRTKALEADVKTLAIAQENADERTSAMESQQFAKPDEITSHHAARALGLKTRTGNWHDKAVVALSRRLNHAERGLARRVSDPDNGYKQWVYSVEGLEDLRSYLDRHHPVGQDFEVPHRNQRFQVERTRAVPVYVHPKVTRSL